MPKPRINVMFYAASGVSFLPFCGFMTPPPRPAAARIAGKSRPHKKPAGAREAKRGGAGGVSPPAKRLVEHDQVFAGGNGAEL